MIHETFGPRYEEPPIMPNRGTWLAAFALGLVSMLVLSTGQPVRAQAVGFIPVIGSFPDGVVMSTTPVVSADRRYVRVGVDAQFTGLIGLTSVNFPAAAAAGGSGNGGFGGWAVVLGGWVAAAVQAVVAVAAGSGSWIATRLNSSRFTEWAHPRPQPFSPATRICPLDRC